MSGPRWLALSIAGDTVAQVATGGFLVALFLRAHLRRRRIDAESCGRFEAIDHGTVPGSFVRRQVGSNLGLFDEHQVVVATQAKRTLRVDGREYLMRRHKQANLTRYQRLNGWGILELVEIPGGRRVLYEERVGGCRRLCQDGGTSFEERVLLGSAIKLMELVADDGAVVMALRWTKPPRVRLGPFISPWPRFSDGQAVIYQPQTVENSALLILLAFVRFQIACTPTPG